MMNLWNILCSVHFDVQIAENDKPLQPDAREGMLKQLRASRGFWTRRPTTINADPFLFVHDGKLFLFYEEMGEIYTNGRIMMTWTPDLKNWSAPQVVLAEAWHLSYPFVFAAEGKVWMMPEGWRSGGIRLYSATDDSLQHWQKDELLIPGERLVDSSLFVRDGVFYLHTCSMEKGRNLLRLYTAGSLHGPWTEHPCSPVAESRNGGALHECGGRLFRFAQRCDVYYGDGLDLVEIKEMTPKSYEEILVKDHFIRKGHHYSIAEFQGKVLTARSYAFLSFMFFEFFRRVCHYLPFKNKSLCTKK